MTDRDISDIVYKIKFWHLMEVGEMKTTNDLYLAAVAALKAGREMYGVATHVLNDGGTVYCCVKPVAGMSIKARHFRTTFDIKAATENHSKPISRANVAKLMKIDGEKA